VLKLIRGMAGLRQWPDASVVTIGNFDGVHCGHQKMLKRLCEKSRELGLPSVLVTFEPLPHEFFAADKAHARLMSLREKLQYLSANTDLDAVLCLVFNRALSGQPAEHFISEIVLDGLSAKYVLLGDDFRFGHQRTGDYKLLQNMSAAGGFEVEAMASINVGAVRVSSTGVRVALAQGDLAQAQSLLGRPYRLSGRVVKGDQLGRTLGYPTANIHLRRQHLPLSGVFAVFMHGLGECVYQGMANIGWRPTVGGRELRFEVNLLDFDEDIYGRHVEIDFVAKLRDEQRFDSLDDLKVQLAADESATRDYFAGAAF